MGRVFEYSFQIRRNEKYDVHSKMFDIINLALEGYFIFYNENKIAFCLKKELF